MPIANRDEVRTLTFKKPRLGQPLPWILLGVATLAGISSFVSLRTELSAERTRSADSLRTSDESLHKLKQVEGRIEALTNQIAELEDEKKSLTAHADALAQEIRRQDSAMALLAPIEESLKAALAPELRSGLARIEPEGLKIRVELAERALFEGNDVAPTKRGEELLVRIAKALDADNETFVAVGVHLDSGKPPDKVAAQYPTVWDLSSSRATQLVRVLTDSGTVAPGRLSAVGFGASRPVTLTGPKARNRRVELVISRPAPGEPPPSIAAAPPTIKKTPGAPQPSKPAARKPDRK